MESFFKYFHQDFGLIFKALWKIVQDVFQFLNTLLNFPMRMKMIESFKEEFTVPSWILVGLVNLLLIAAIVFVIVLLVKGIRRLFRFRVPVKEYEEMKAEVARLQREVFKLSYEKDKILAMKMTEHGVASIFMSLAAQKM